MKETSDPFPIRIGILRSLVGFGALTVAITELLSLFGGVKPAAIAVVWGVVIVALLFLGPRRAPRRQFRLAWFPVTAAASIALIAILIGYTALLSPPNSADTMSYHLPRVLHWMQNESVRFFPTSYLNLIMLQPAAEYMMLHAYVLSGTDAFSNLFQFAAFLGCILGVSCLAGLYGLSANAQAVAAVFCATLPNAILQASGAKNDVILACFLVCAAAFAKRWQATRAHSDLFFFALATGMAFCTKGTAYLFAPPLIMAIVSVRDWPRIGVVALAGILALNTPQFIRNVDLSGSPIGFDSAHADGVYRWRVERFGWKPTVSNMLRNISEQLGGRSENWNQRVFQTVVGIHHGLGIDPQDVNTTWHWAEFRPPRNSNHEADANNKWHLVIFVLALTFCRGPWIRYAAGVIGGFLLFCFYLKWQPYFSRVEVPLFVLMSPVAAVAIARIPFTLAQAAICAILLSNARLPLIQNWTRPFTGAKSILHTDRNEGYFNDVGQWSNREAYLQSVAATASTQCRLVGIDTSQYHVQYPYMILLRQRVPDVRFVETGVSNPSRKYADPSIPEPCAVLCPHCNDDPARVSRYKSQYGEPEIYDNFLLFLRK